MNLFWEVLTRSLKKYYFLNDFPFFLLSFLSPSLPGISLSFSMYNILQDPCLFSNHLWQVFLSFSQACIVLPFLVSLPCFPLAFLEITSQINYLPLHEDSKFSEVCSIFDCPFILNVKQLN